ncbi:MAG: DNA repair protein RecN [Acidobacteria bacterium]|nr:DNA repair protein RecN [Acidobacteriota bacterium]
MLRHLRIRDFALIRELEADFEAGLNLLTGETGSGKSIVVDALGLLGGDRASPEMVRSGAELALIEGGFEVGPESDVIHTLNEAGIPCSEDLILLRREISATGRSRAFINDSPVTLALTRTVGEKLVDIHGQHDRQMLLDLSAHLGWLDRFGSNAPAVSAVRNLYEKLREIDRKLESLRLDEQERLRRVDVLEFQVGEIRRIDPRPEEKESLETEKKVLTNRERILSIANEAYGLLYENETSVLAQVNRLARLLQELESMDGRWSAHREGLQESRYRLEELSYAVRDYTTEIDFSPGRLDQIEQRLSDLDRLARKYGESVAAILEFAGRAEKQLQELLSHEETSRALDKELVTQLGEYAAVAARLSKKRQGDALRLERELRKEFRSLAMDKMEMKVLFHPAQGDGGGRIPAAYGPSGMDRVEFLVAPNEGEELKPLAKIASGGELSRIMLAIRAICGSMDPDRTLVFDEVDAGVGGRAAEALGRRLLEIARTNQVLCVTHLPQIAAFADQHYSVQKGVVGSRTETSIRNLDYTARVEELARMLGGSIITDTSRRHATEMLKQSRNTSAHKAGHRAG